MSDVAKTPREELECKKKYLYEYSMFWECKDGSKCQILEDDVCELLNGQQSKITELEIELTDCKNRKEQLEYKNTKLIAKIDFLERVIDGDINE